MEIMTLIRRAKLTMETFNRYIDLNAQFHGALLDLSRSRMLRRAIQQACSLPFASPSAFLKRQFISSDTREIYLISADQHCGIVDAIQHREGCALKSSLGNMRAWRGGILRTLFETPNPPSIWQVLK